MAPWRRGEEVAPSWPKAVYRRGVALRGLKRFDMAISAFAQGMEQDTGPKQRTVQGLDGSVIV